MLQRRFKNGNGSLSEVSCDHAYTQSCSKLQRIGCLTNRKSYFPWIVLSDRIVLQGATLKFKDVVTNTPFSCRWLLSPITHSIGYHDSSLPRCKVGCVDLSQKFPHSVYMKVTSIALRLFILHYPACGYTAIYVVIECYHMTHC